MLNNRRLNSLTVAVIALLSVLVTSSNPACVQADSPGADTLAALSNNVIPPHDTVDLARRLLGLKNLPSTPAAAKQYNVGDQAQFTAQNDDKVEDFTFTATLM